MRLGTAPPISQLHRYSLSDSTLTALRLRGGNEGLIFSSHTWQIFFERGVNFVNYFGGCLLLLAVSISLLNTLLFFVNRIVGTSFPVLVSYTNSAKPVPVQLTRVRFQLGSMIALALMVMVAADVLETLVQPASELTLETLYKLGLVAIIRTGLAYFLGKEMKEVEEELEHFDGENITV